MTTPSTGKISLLDVQNEFGGTTPISLSEYYAGSSFVGAGMPGIPSSGKVGIDAMRGKNGMILYYRGASSVFTVGNETVVVFNSSGSIIPVGAYSYHSLRGLCVGGGGGCNGAGNYQTAAGGGGGVNENSNLAYASNNEYVINVGAGAVGVQGQISPIIYGGTSSIGSLISAAGGATAYNSDNNADNSTGGTSGNGYGGVGHAGGGGGAGGGASGDNGGNGVISSITGTSTYYGGGGSGHNGTPGAGGGGAGRAYGAGAGTSGTNGLGGGGGGTGGFGGTSNGGSGVVIVRGVFSAVAY